MNLTYEKSLEEALMSIMEQDISVLKKTIVWLFMLFGVVLFFYVLFKSPGLCWVLIAGECLDVLIKLFFNRK